MSDLISRTALFNACANLHDKGEIFATIQNAPTVDAVEVVRCKECKMAHDPDVTVFRDRVITCGLYASRPIMRCDDYCSYGERKDAK